MIKVLRLVTQSIRRSLPDFLFASLGIVIGISTLLFFTALGAGIKNTVLEKVFVIRQLEVVPKTYDVGVFQSAGLFGQKSLDDQTVQKFSKMPGVASVYPKMRLTFPTSVIGGKAILGRNMRVDLVADGIPEDLVEPDAVAKGEPAFRDWDEPLGCGADASVCPQGFSCAKDSSICQGDACTIEDLAACPGASYCEARTLQCAMPIPVVIAPQLLEVYNGSIHTALGGSSGAMSKLPKLGKKALLGLEADVVLGQSVFMGTAAKGTVERRRIRLVGFSDKAIGLGATMPIGYIKRFNKAYSAVENQQYHSIVVETATNDAITAVAQSIESGGYALSDKFKDAKRASLLIVIITMIFNLISVIILAVAAVNIMHTFLMLILERQREFGLMRALGATSAKVRTMIMVEAAALGLFGGVVGVGVGVAMTKIADTVFATQVKDFPFKPESLFSLHPWMVAMCLGASLFFCVLGALWPAIRASRMDPARALTS